MSTLCRIEEFKKSLLPNGKDSIAEKEHISSQENVSSRHKSSDYNNTIHIPSHVEEDSDIMRKKILTRFKKANHLKLSSLLQQKRKNEQPSSNTDSLLLTGNEKQTKKSKSLNKQGVLEDISSEIQFPIKGIFNRGKVSNILDRPLILTEAKIAEQHSATIENKTSKKKHSKRKTNTSRQVKIENNESTSLESFLESTSGMPTIKRITNGLNFDNNEKTKISYQGIQNNEYFDQVNSKLIQKIQSAKTQNSHRRNNLQSEYFAKMSQNIAHGYFLFIENCKKEEIQIKEVSNLLEEVEMVLKSLNTKVLNSKFSTRQWKISANKQLQFKPTTCSKLFEHSNNTLRIKFQSDTLNKEIQFLDTEFSTEGNTRKQIDSIKLSTLNDPSIFEVTGIGLTKQNSSASLPVGDNREGLKSMPSNISLVDRQKFRDYMKVRWQ